MQKYRNSFKKEGFITFFSSFLMFYVSFSYQISIPPIRVSFAFTSNLNSAMSREPPQTPRRFTDLQTLQDKHQQWKEAHSATSFHQIGGERGIRTPGASQHGGFQDRCNRPLYHLSLTGTPISFFSKASAKIGHFFYFSKFYIRFLYF